MLITILLESFHFVDGRFEGWKRLNLTTEIHIFDTENKQKLNIIKANSHNQKKYARCNVSQQMCQTIECTTHQAAALRAQIKDFPVLCSTLLHRTGPYVITLADK